MEMIRSLHEPKNHAGDEHLVLLILNCGEGTVKLTYAPLGIVEKSPPIAPQQSSKTRKHAFTVGAVFDVDIEYPCE